MKKALRRQIGGQWEIIPWILMFPAIWGITYWEVEEQFGYISSKYVSVQQSIEAYMWEITIIMFFVLIMTMFWWGIALCKLSIRKSFEEKTLWWAITFIIVVGFVVYVCSRNSGIVDNTGEKQLLFYSNYITKGIIINLLIFPPRNVNKVIFVGGDFGRLVLGVGLGIMWYVI